MADNVDWENRIGSLEKRVSALENLVKPSGAQQKKSAPKKNYRGLKGGINFLLDDGFFDSPQYIGGTEKELKRHSYHYPIASISTALIRMAKPQGPLTRINDKEGWKYVRRK